MRHCEISLWWVQLRYGSHFNIDWRYNVCHDRPPTTYYSSSASWCLVTATLLVTQSNTKKHVWTHIGRWNWECLALWESTWKYRAKQAGSLSCNAIVNILESMLGSMLESILWAYIGAYMAVSIPSCAIRSIVASMLWSVLENVLGGIPENILEVYLDAPWELTW
jgi:hypothetical protein